MDEVGFLMEHPTGPQTPQEVQRYLDTKVEQALVREDVRRLAKVIDRERPKEDQRHAWETQRSRKLSDQQRHEAMAAEAVTQPDRAYWRQRAAEDAAMVSAADVALAGLR